MSHVITTDLGPNYERDDVRLAFQLLRRPRQWVSGSAIERLEARVREWLPGRFAVAFGTGRSALWAALSALQLDGSGEVLLQAFTCVAVPGAVRWAAGRPVYVDVAPATFNLNPRDLEKKITPRSRAIIVQHTFGYPAPMDAIAAIARRHQLVLIEDCAHAVGSTYRGKRLGALGDLAIFSFGRDKALSSVFGGMVATNDAALAQRLTTFRVQYTTSPPRRWVAQQLLHPYLTTTARRTLGVGGFGKAWLKLAKASHLLSLAVEPCERSGLAPSFKSFRTANALAILALHQWEKIDRFVRHREGVARQYVAGLQGLRGCGLPQVVSGGRAVPIRFPVTCERPTELLEDAERQGIHLGEWYRPVIAPPGVRLERVSYAVGSCPNAERLAASVVNLPTHIGIGPSEAQRIVALVRQHCS